VLHITKQLATLAIFSFHLLPLIILVWLIIYSRPKTFPETIVGLHTMVFLASTASDTLFLIALTTLIIIPTNLVL
jgi:hypothetical protein